jgi:hypothetical protein
VGAIVSTKMGLERELERLAEWRTENSPVPHPLCAFLEASISFPIDYPSKILAVDYDVHQPIRPKDESSSLGESDLRGWLLPCHSIVSLWRPHVCPVASALLHRRNTSRNILLGPHQRCPDCADHPFGVSAASLHITAHEAAHLGSDNVLT